MAVIDCLVHPQVVEKDELRRYMDEPWNERSFPPPDRYFYPVPDGQYLKEAITGAALPGSDPSQVLARMDEAGIDVSILLPLTRGLLPDLDLGSAICTGTNRWLAETWLGTWNSNGRFKGSIRVNPADTVGAVREIETWASHPHMVQVAVPMQAHHPYGQRMYHDVWQAAARHGLPIAVAADGGCGVDLFPTAVGYARHYVEYSTLYPLNFAFHLASLIAEGVFARIPQFRVVFTDGGADLAMPIMWRLDKDWRATKPETPWVEDLPSRYLKRHVRFVTRRLEGPASHQDQEMVARVGDYQDLLIYGSRYPNWDCQPVQDVRSGLPPTVATAVLGSTAANFYHLSSDSRRPSRSRR